MLTEALGVHPEAAAPHLQRGQLALSQNKHADAIDPLTKAIELDPQNAPARCQLALALCESDRPDDALEMANAALEIDPELSGAHQALGLLAYRRMDYDDALTHLLKAQELSPGDAAIHHNLGSVHMQIGDPAAALKSYNKAVWLEPARVDARLSRAFVMLRDENWEDGWREYEWRRMDPKRKYPKLPKPVWDGSPIEGKTVLLYGEQGLGDTLQFIRYAQPTRDLGAKRVVVAVQPILKEVLSRTEGIDTMVGLGEPVASDFDCYAPLMSLPGILETPPEAHADCVPYLHPDPERAERWRERLPDEGTFRIGIAWQGNKKFVDDRQRSIALSHYAPLAEIPNVTLVSLQKGDGTEQIADCGFAVHTLGEEFDSDGHAFADTAAIAGLLDLVVTSDSAIAHLLGGLGIETYLALPYNADWRWLADRDDCPWYPTMTLFRQTERGHWPEVFTRIAEAVQTRIEQGDQ